MNSGDMFDITHAQLDEQVEAALGALLNAPVHRDDDGDIPLHIDDCPAYVSTVYDACAIDLWAPLTLGIADTAQAAFAVHYFNGRFPDLKFRLVADRIIVGCRVPANPLITAHVERAVGHLGDALTERAEVAANLGGRTPDGPQRDWRDDEQERERTILRTLFELQHADQPLSTENIAAICGRDQQTILNVLALSNNLESQLRDDADNDLDPEHAAHDRASAEDWKRTSDALRSALRLIVLPDGS